MEAYLLKGVGCGDVYLIEDFLPSHLLEQIQANEQTEFEWTQLSNLKHAQPFPRLSAFQVPELQK